MKLATGFLTLALLAAPIALAQSSPSTAASASPQAKSAEAQPSTENHPVDWAPLQYVELWNTGKTDFDLQAKLFNPSVIMHSRGNRLFLSPAMLASVIRAWRNSMPDLKFNVEDKIIQGNKVVLRLAFTGTYTKILWPATLQPSDFNPPRKIHSEEILIFNVKEGKINEIWEMYNEPKMRLMMGSVWRPLSGPSAAGASSTARPAVPAPAPNAPDNPRSNP